MQCSRSWLQQSWWSFREYYTTISIPSKYFSNKRKNIWVNIQFQHLVTTEDFLKEINKLDSKKSSTGVSISLLKENVDVFAPKLTEIFNSCISKGIFPDELKVADISPIFKSVDSTAKKNYQPVIILKSVSKLFEKMI